VIGCESLYHKMTYRQETTPVVMFYVKNIHIFVQLFHKNCKIFKSLVFLGAFVCSIVRDGKKFTDWLILLHQTDTLSYSSNTPTKKEWEWLNNLKEHVEKCVWEKTNLSFYNFSAHSELARHSAHLIWKDSSKYRIRIMLLSRSLQKNCFVFRSETC
jgi:hypothetical protein